ncbi:MAG: CDP-alcohol phosphatidyltransferase family protein [Anaerolineales bacterium]|nr:CDP-alcohol phosphatidyltransferase family protein [Anaerolineales bacterium]
MFRYKTIADVLTITRVFCGFYLFLLALGGKPDTLPIAASILLLSWATDILDGPLARKGKANNSTWVGQHDLTADQLVGTGVWLYLWSADYVSPVFGVGYLALSILLLLWTRSVHVAWAVQAIPYLMMIITVYVYTKVFAIILVTWLLLVTLVTWPRFTQEKVPEFLGGIAKLFKH